MFPLPDNARCGYVLYRERLVFSPRTPVHPHLRLLHSYTFDITFHAAKRLVMLYLYTISHVILSFFLSFPSLPVRRLPVLGDRRPDRCLGVIPIKDRPLQPSSPWPGLSPILFAQSYVPCLTHLHARLLASPATRSLPIVTAPHFT